MITVNYAQIKQPKEKRQPCQNSLKRNIIRDYFLWSKDIWYCLKHDLRWICKNFIAENADMASVNQTDRFILIAWNSAENSRRANLAPCRGGESKKSSPRNLYYYFRGNGRIERICCTEAERTQRLKMDELSRQESEESHFTVNQLTVQFQELKDEANSLSVSRDFHPETASSSGLSHFPVALSLFRVLLECIAAILAQSLIHGTCLVHRESLF